MWIILLLFAIIILHFIYNKQKKNMENIEKFNTGPYPDKIYPNLALRNSSCLINYSLEDNPYMIWDKTFKEPIKRNDTRNYEDEIADAFEAIRKQDEEIEKVKTSKPNEILQKKYTDNFKYCKIFYENKNNCFVIFRDEDCYKGQIQQGTFGCDV